MFTKLMPFFSNWKTTGIAGLVIGLTIVEKGLGIDIPGFEIDVGTALAVSAGLFFAGDANAFTPKGKK